MKVRVRQCAALLLAGTMAAGMLAGCGGDNGGSGKDGKTTADGKVKLTALFNKHSLTQDVNDMQWLKELEEKCNVEIEWEQISADWDQKKSAMFASGNIPDLIFKGTADSDYVQYKGLFEDMSPLIEEHAPNIQAMFSDHPEIKQLATTTSGEIYGIPSYKSVWPYSTASMFINKQWLDNLGLEVPTNWDELEQVLLAFKNEDANGNGDTTDEIPMDFNIFNWEYSPKILLGSLGIQLTNNATDGYFAEDGKIKSYFTDDRFKTLLEFLQKLNSEGLISKEAFTQDYSKYQSVARGSGKDAKVGFTWGWESGDRFGNEIKDQYITMKPLAYSADSDYDLKYINDKYYQNYQPNAVAMSANCKNKEAAMKFIDAFYNPEESIQVLWGGMNDTDKGIKKNDDGSYEVLPPADSSLDPGSWKWTKTFADNGPYYIKDGMNITLGEDMRTVTEEKQVYEEYWDKVDPKSNEYPQTFMKYSEEDTNTLAMNQANIINIFEQQTASWVTGKGDIDKEWGAYVESLNSAGIIQNLEIRQKAYDDYLKSLK